MSETRSNDLMERFNALSLGEKIILPAGILLLIISFFPWYSIDLGVFGSVNRSGWQSPGAIWSILAVLIGVVMSAIVAVRAFASAGTLPDDVSGVTWPKIMLGLGAAAALFIVIKLINESSHLAIGFFLGIIAVAALVAGGALMYREEMESGTSSSS